MDFELTTSQLESMFQQHIFYNADTFFFNQTILPTL